MSPQDPNFCPKGNKRGENTPHTAQGTHPSFSLVLSHVSSRNRSAQKVRDFTIKQRAEVWIMMGNTRCWAEDKKIKYLGDQKNKMQSYRVKASLIWARKYGMSNQTPNLI